MTDKEQLVTEGEARVVVKAADMAEVMQQEAINVAIEVRAPRPDLLEVSGGRCYAGGLPPSLFFPGDGPGDRGARARGWRPGGRREVQGALTPAVPSCVRLSSQASGLSCVGQD